MPNLPEVVEWRGPGWYASMQEGAYEDTHIHTYHIGGPELESAPETNLWTPFLILEKDEWNERNPDARLIEH